MVEIVAVAIDTDTDFGAERRALGVDDPRIMLERGRLACRGNLERLVDSKIPGVVEIQLRELGRQQPGIGKTRLLEAMAEDANWRGFGVLWGEAVQGEAARSFQPLAAALAGALSRLRSEQLAAQGEDFVLLTEEQLQLALRQQQLLAQLFVFFDDLLYMLGCRTTGTGFE